MSSHSPKIWQPLNIARREIRLLLLDPSSDFAAPLSGCLSSVSLDDQPSYNAISHAWGRAGNVQTLRLDGKPMVITSEIGTCLRHFRYHARVGALWIDAVCIDQENLTERSNQVELMRHIFSRQQSLTSGLGIIYVPLRNLCKT